MQSILRENLNRLELFNQIDRLYFNSSERLYPGLIPDVYDESLLDICMLLENNVEWFKMPRLMNFEFKPIDVVHDDNTVIVCVSGGKDSVALVKLLVDEGRNVILYHMRGINKVYYDEFEAVKRIAKHLNLPYYIDNVVLCGTHKYIEHPLKNFIIANGAINYALENNLPINIAFGNFSDSYLEDNEFDVCAGDCMDMWYAYESAVRTVIPNFRMIIPLHNNDTSLRIIKDNPDLLPLTMSCISPYRFRDHWQKRTSKKYGVKLMPNRCGCCWKCCMEYIYYVDNNLLEYNEPYYLHCIEILNNTINKESAIKVTSVEDTWNEYLNYPIRKSRAWEKLKNAIIQNGKIKCITESIK